MKGIITIIIIIIIIAIGFLLLRDGTATTENADTVTSEVPAPGAIGSVDEMIVNEDGQVDTTVEVIVVTYTSGGFTPKEITVSVGQIVRFVNESSGNMWVASVVHPTHTVLPEFDEKESIGAGENYEFTFTKIGEWKYHNHVNPSRGGVVIVE